MKQNRTFDIPIQDKERCDRINENSENNFKPTEDHINDVLDAIYNMILSAGETGGWYIYDSIKVKIEVEYCPEDK